MIDLVAADADPEKLKVDKAITVIVVRTLGFFIFSASPCTCFLFLARESFHRALVINSESASASTLLGIPCVTRKWYKKCDSGDSNKFNMK